MGCVSSSNIGDITMAKALHWDVTADGATINRMQLDLNKRTAKVHEHMAILAASCVLHMLEHQNATPMTRFVNEAGDSVRKDAIVRWALKLGMFKVGKAKDESTGKSVDVFKKNDEGFIAALAKYTDNKDAYAKDLVSKPFYDAGKNKNPFAGYSVLAKMYAILDEAERILADNARKDHKNNDFRGLVELRAGLAKHERPANKRKAKKESSEITVVPASDYIDFSQSAATVN